MIERAQTQFKKTVSDRLLAGLILITIFLVPSNLFLKLCENCGYSSGLLSDYLITKLYLLDILVVASIVAGIWHFWKNIQHTLSEWRKLIKPTTIPLLFWLALLPIQFISSEPMVGITTWIRFTSYFAFGWLTYTWLNTKRKNVHLLLVALQSSMIFQFCLVVYQWYAQEELLGFLLLGEPLLQDQPGLEKTIISGAEWMTPYGTTPHPNVLAGITALIMVISIWHWVEQNANNQLKKVMFLTISMCAGFGMLILTQSASAAGVILLGGIILSLRQSDIYAACRVPFVQLQRYVVWTLLFVWVFIAFGTYQIGITQIQSPSLYRRAYLLESSIAMMAQNSVFGAGLGQFTAVSPQKIRPYESARFNQPPHHVLALWISETGILGIGILITAIHVMLNKNRYREPAIIYLLLLTPLVVWDHYLLSLPQGILISLIGATFLMYSVHPRLKKFKG